jgi:hypothetical protein
MPRIADGRWPHGQKMAMMPHVVQRGCYRWKLSLQPMWTDRLANKIFGRRATTPRACYST